MIMLCRILSIVVSVWVAVGCVSHHSERMADVNPVEWNATDTARVEIVNSDTTSTRRIDILIRTNNKLSTEELPLRVITTNPKGEALESVFSISLSNPTRVSDSFNQTITPFIFNATLPLKGGYRFEFVPMVDNVRGVASIGIKIE